MACQDVYIEPARPGNGYCESFNARFRDELLNGEIFYGLKEAHMRSVDLWSGYQIHWRGDVGMEPAVQQTDFASLYLLSEILREKFGRAATLLHRQTKGRVAAYGTTYCGALPSLVKTPDFNAFGDSVPHEMAYNILLVLVARSSDDDICLCNAAVLHQKAVGDDPINVLVVQKLDLPSTIKSDAPTLEVSAPASEVFHLIPGIVRFSVVQPEPPRRKPIE